MRRAARPKRRRATDANPDLQFLTVDELEAVLRTIPDEVVYRVPAPTRRGRRGPAPPPPADVLGPVLRPLIFNALIIPALVPLALRGVRYRPLGATALLRRNLLIYGLGGLIAPFTGIKLIDLIVHNLLGA